MSGSKSSSAKRNKLIKMPILQCILLIASPANIGHVVYPVMHLLSYRRVFYVHVHSKHKSPDCHKFKGVFLFSDVCRLCFQHLVLIAAIFAGFGRKPENASGVQGMPPINAKRRATFVLFQQVNH